MQTPPITSLHPHSSPDQPEEKQVGNVKKEFEGVTTVHHVDAVYSLCKGNDELYAAGVGWSIPFTIHITEYSNSKILRSLTGHSDIIWRGYRHKKSNHLLSLSFDKDIRIWNWSNGSCIAILKGHCKYVRDIAELKTGDVITVSDDWSIKYWNMNTFKCSKTIKDAHYDFINSVLLFKGDTQGITGGYDKGFKVWKVSAERKEDVSTSVNTGSPIWSGLAVNSTRGLVGLKAGNIGMYNTEKLTQEGMLKQHTSLVTIMMLLSDGNGISGSADSKLIIWDVDTCSCLQQLGEHATDIKTGGIEMRDNEIMSGSKDKTVKTWVKR